MLSAVFLGDTLWLDSWILNGVLGAFFRRSNVGESTVSNLQLVAYEFLEESSYGEVYTLGERGENKMSDGGMDEKYILGYC